MTPAPAANPIGLPTFERVFRTIHGYLLSENGDPAKACLAFGIIGAAILKQHHNLNAFPVVGAAMYRLASSNEILIIGTTENGEYVSTKEAFHCWVEVNGWYVDFQSPLFPDMLPPASQAICERRMFQRRLDAAKADLSHLRLPGDYACIVNRALTMDLIRQFLSRPAYADILQICVDWYREIPAEMNELLHIANNAGEVTEVRISPLRVDGTW